MRETAKRLVWTAGGLLLAGGMMTLLGEESDVKDDQAEKRLNYVLTNLGVTPDLNEKMTQTTDDSKDSEAEAAESKAKPETVVIDGEVVDALTREDGEESNAESKPAEEQQDTPTEPTDDAPKDQEEWERFTPFLDSLFDEEEQPSKSVPEDALQASEDGADAEDEDSAASDMNVDSDVKRLADREAESVVKEVVAVTLPVGDAETQSASSQSAMPSAPQDQPRTLDDLLRAAEDSTTVRNQRMLSRLVETEQVALAHMAALEAAQSVADYGQAGLKLLANANLEVVVETLIEKAERERMEKRAPAADSTKAVAAQIVQPPASNHVGNAEPEEENDMGFDAWRPSYALKERHGVRVGWVNDATGERRSTNQGTAWTVNGDRIVLLGVRQDEGGRVVQIEINGEARDVPIR